MDQSNSIADDILRNGFERWQRLEGEKQAISDDLKELFAELKGQGFDSKALRASFRMVAKAGDVAVEEHNALVDLYVGSLMAPKNSGTGTVPATRTRAAREAETEERTEALAALRADPALAVVDVANLKNNSEPQPSPQAGSDLTVPPSPQGQVAPIQPETANKVPQSYRSVVAPASAAPAPDYPAPGEVYWENAPKRPVHRHEYSAAFGDLGQDHYVIKDDISCARSAPIVLIGDAILDGWARYNCARCMVGLDGQTAQYPAVQYDGTDPLIDCIKLNAEGRILDEQQKRVIAAKLTRLEPKRKDDIYKAFGVWMEPV